jgi:hypothetical protein
LEAVVFQISYQAPSLLRILTDPLKRLEEALSKLQDLPSNWPVIVKMFWWLSTSHPL